eukprot:COSAG02_NODE_28995_length_578_cov_0.643006_1_plen_71_part_01
MITPQWGTQIFILQHYQVLTTASSANLTSVVRLTLTDKLAVQSLCHGPRISESEPYQKCYKPTYRQHLRTC